MLLVGHQAPDFYFNSVSKSKELVKGQLFSSYRDQRPTLLFFYPLDFTFVCPSELLALDDAMDEFEKLGVKVLSVSVDSEFTHLAWQKTSLSEGGLGSVNFDMAADVSHQICQLYGVEHYQAKIALRAAFMIDAQGYVRSQIVNDLPIGRSIDEILRVFEAIEHTQKHGEVCPANWSKGKKGMKASPEGVKNYLKEHRTHKD